MSNIDSFPLRPTSAEVRELLLNDHASTRTQFVSHFGVELSALSEALTAAFVAYRDLDDQVRGELRVATVLGFVFTALNSVVTSSQLLLSGMLIPAGNLMRQYGEATAMALLCSNPKLDTFDRFDAARKTFPVHDAMHLAARKAALRELDINEDDWARFTEINKFYDRFSHPTQLAVASQFMFSRSGMIVLGGEFDSAKVDQYRIEFARRRSAAEVLTSTTRAILKALLVRRNPATLSNREHR